MSIVRKANRLLIRVKARHSTFDFGEEKQVDGKIFAICLSIEIKNEKKENSVLLNSLLIG